MNSARPSTSVEPAGRPAFSSAGSGLRETTITAQCGCPPPGTARRRQATSSSQRVHSPTFRASLSSCSTASSMRDPFCRRSGRRRARRRPTRSGAGRDEPVLAGQGAGLAHENAQELVPEGRQPLAERVNLEGDVLRRGLAELAGHPAAKYISLEFDTLNVVLAPFGDELLLVLVGEPGALICEYRLNTTGA